MTPAEAIADGGLHHALAVGPRQKLEHEQVMELSSYECELLCDGEPVSRGHGVDVLGGPLQAVGWLLIGLSARLRAGEIITTGKLTRAEPVIRGERWSHRALQPTLLGTVETSFG